MAARVLKTRIQNKLDTLAAWTTEDPVLLYGEIAVAQSSEQHFDETQGKDITVHTYLMKVGDGSTHFNSLPWLTAPASDVSSWAKSENAEDVRVAITEGGASVTKTLSEWFQQIAETQAAQDDAIAINTAKLTGHTDAAIDKLITDKLATLDSTSTGSGIVKDIVQIDGKVTITKGALTVSEVPELPASKIVVTADNTSTPDTNEKVTLDAKLADITKDLQNINATIAGGVHFIGIVSTPPDLSKALTTQTITLDDNRLHIAQAGDVVIQGEKEYIWAGSAWIELGDLTRVGNLEARINNLDYTDSAIQSQFVTQVSQVDGKITVSRARPTSADVQHGTTTTVNAELTSHASRISETEKQLESLTELTTSISDTINSLDVAEPSASGTATSFINMLRQENGKIIVTKANLPSATTTSAGIVKLGESGGAATFEATSAAASKATDSQNRVAAVEGNYVRFNSTDSKLYIGKSGTDEIIFDCGNAPRS